MPQFNTAPKQQLSFFDAKPVPATPAETEVRVPEQRELTEAEKARNAAHARYDAAHRDWVLANNSGQPATRLAELWARTEIAWLESIAWRAAIDGTRALADYELARSISRLVQNGMTIEQLLDEVAHGVSIAGEGNPVNSFVCDALHKFAAEKMPAVRQKMGGARSGD